LIVSLIEPLIIKFNLFLKVIFLEKISRFEKARLLSARALQLSLGAPPLVKAEHEKTMYEMSKKEFEHKVLPLNILRTFPNGEVREIDWN